MKICVATKTFVGTTVAACYLELSGRFIHHGLGHDPPVESASSFSYSRAISAPPKLPKLKLGEPYGRRYTTIEAAAESPTFKASFRAAMDQIDADPTAQARTVSEDGSGIAESWVDHTPSSDLLAPDTAKLSRYQRKATSNNFICPKLSEAQDEIRGPVASKLSQISGHVNALHNELLPATKNSVEKALSGFNNHILTAKTSVEALDESRFLVSSDVMTIADSLPGLEGRVKSNLTQIQQTMKLVELISARLTRDA